MIGTPQQLFDKIRASFQALADADRAQAMQNYMKSEMPFYGIQTPGRRKICRALFKE